MAALKSEEKSVIFVALDVSESMNIRETNGLTRIENLKTSIFNLVSSLSSECDPSTHVVIEKFNGLSETVYDGPLEGLNFAEEWTKLRTGGNTCLYYVVHKGIDLLLNHKNPNKFFICATDGINTVKPEYQAVSQNLIREATAKGVNIFYIGNDKFTCENGTAQMGIPKDDVYSMEGCVIPPILIRSITARAKSNNEPEIIPEDKEAAAVLDEDIFQDSFGVAPSYPVGGASAEAQPLEASLTHPDSPTGVDALGQSVRHIIDLTDE